MRSRLMFSGQGLRTGRLCSKARTFWVCRRRGGRGKLVLGRRHHEIFKLQFQLCRSAGPRPPSAARKARASACRFATQDERSALQHWKASPARWRPPACALVASTSQLAAAATTMSHSPSIRSRIWRLVSSAPIGAGKTRRQIIRQFDELRFAGREGFLQVAQKQRPGQARAAFATSFPERSAGCLRHSRASVVMLRKSTDNHFSEEKYQICDIGFARRSLWHMISPTCAGARFDPGAKLRFLIHQSIQR